MSSVAKNLKILRELHDYTQEYVADYMGVSQNTYSMIERGETRITIDRLETLATLYNMDIADILKLNDSMIIHNLHDVKDNNGVVGNNKDIIINNNSSEEDRKFFQEVLERLEQEKEKLLQLIEQLIGEKKNNK